MHERMVLQKRYYSQDVISCIALRRLCGIFLTALLHFGMSNLV